MKAISSAIVALAGSVLFVSTEGDTNFYHGIGSIVLLIGMIGWLVAYFFDNESK